MTHSTWTFWIWAVLGGVVVARCWAIRSALAWPLTLLLGVVFADLWAELTALFGGAASRAEIGSRHVGSAFLATVLAASLPFVGLALRRPSARSGSRRLRRNGERMTDGDFEAVQDLLEQQGLAVVRARHDRQTFGSWTIEVGARPRLRVAWDGKEEWLMVDEETERVRDGMRVWRTLWTAESQAQRTPEHAVAALRAALERA